MRHVAGGAIAVSAFFGLRGKRKRPAPLAGAGRCGGSVLKRVQERMEVQ